MPFQIRKATALDLQELLRIYAAAKGIMDAAGNPNQWAAGYPGEALLLNDIRQDFLHVVIREGIIRGCFVLATGEDPTYREIYEGAWSSVAPYATIHRLAGDGSGGIFDACMEYAKSLHPYLRIDTHRDNRIMLKKLPRAGFRRCGIIYLENGSERIAFDYEKESPAS